VWVNTGTLRVDRDSGIPLQRTRSDGRSISNTQTTLLADLLVEVLFGEGIEFLAVLLLYGAAFTVEGLHVVQPRDAAQDPCIYWFEAILCKHVSWLLVEHDPADRQPTNLQLGAELRRDVNLGHAGITRCRGRVRRGLQPATAAFYTRTMQVAFGKKTRSA